jgi:hypothetical protein
MTLLAVEEVVVAVPSDDEPSSAEVLSFDSEVLIEEFGAELAKRQRKNPEFSPDAPIFIRLEPKKKSLSNGASALAAKARWRTLIPLASVIMQKNTSAQPTESFIERVKREFAEQNGIDVSRVVVEFKIIA